MADLQLTPTAMVAGGAALARDPDGKVVLVEGALPGETVTVRLTDSRRDFARGVTVDVLQASPDRILPPCPAVTAGCGGCTWQHVAPEAQVRLKGDIVVDALRRIGRLDEPPVLMVVPLPEPALRTTARLAVSPGGRAGHRRRRHTEAVETASCLAAHPLLEELVTVGRYPGAGEVLLRVGVASGERLVHARVGWRGVRVPPDVLVVGGDGTRGGRGAFVHEEVAGRRFRVNVHAFFQPGPVAATALAGAVSRGVGDALVPRSHLVDAYAGVGLFASVLGAAGAIRVTAVESDPAAAADARVNLADVDARVVVSEVARWRRPEGEGGVDVVVADPARPGLGRPGVAALAATGAPRLVLVSCDPASLARDARLLAESGYRLSSLALVDAFPHTFHVETVSRFDR